jgi:hypothetical protein
MEEPLVNNTYLLEKFPGKGGWTFAQIPEIPPAKHSYFGWVRVRGSIDSYEFSNYHLMPMGNGMLFLPVKSEIRKKIGKMEGDTVHVILFADNLPTSVPEELKLCFQDEPNVWETFSKYSNGEKKAIVEWIYSAKTDETKIDRIVKVINKIKA